MLEKQARPGHIRDYLQVHRFPEDPSLCPVAAQVCLSQRSRELSHLWRGDLSHTQQLVKNIIVDMDVTAEE